MALLDPDGVNEFLDGFFDSQGAGHMSGERGNLARRLYSVLEEMKAMQFKTPN